jgi:hypothetical protein
MGLYVPLDVNFPSDDKILAAGPAAAYLYVCSLAFSKRSGSDGLIRTAQLPALGVPKPERLAQTLVEVGLWRVVENGWQIVAWLKHNKSKADLDANAERKRQAAVKANHERWHTDKPSEECPLCIRTGSEGESKADSKRREVKSSEVTGRDLISSALAELARRDVTAARAAGTRIHSEPAFFRACLETREIVNGEAVRRMVDSGAYEGFTAADLADQFNAEDRTSGTVLPLGCDECDGGWVTDDENPNVVAACPQCRSPKLRSIAGGAK